MQEVFLFLGAIRQLSPACIADLKTLVKFHAYRKGEVILEKGKINRNLLLVKTGVLCGYSFVEEEPVPSWFFWDMATVVSIGSFYNQVPGKQRIVALEDTDVYYITREEYEFLCETHREFANIARVLLQKYLEIFEEHAWLIRKHSAEERYRWVLTHLPQLLEKVPLKLVAAWLDMSQEHLSRIRGGKA